jgi:GxxExxY protein
MLHADLTQRIIGCAYEVFNALGAGFLESVYERSLLIELQHAGLIARPQVPLDVFYRDEIVGQFFADIIVEQTVIVELKAIDALAKCHEVQLVNYLRATGMQVGLLINFGPKQVEVRRKVCQLPSHPVNPVNPVIPSIQA